MGIEPGFIVIKHIPHAWASSNDNLLHFNCSAGSNCEAISGKTFDWPVSRNIQFIDPIFVSLGDSKKSPFHSTISVVGLQKKAELSHNLGYGRVH